jgi:hypothetical protein
MSLKNINLEDLPTTDIDLAAPPEERWKGAVDPIADEVHAAFELLEAFFDEGMDVLAEHYNFPKGLRSLFKLGASTMMKSGAWVFEQAARIFGLEYAAELKGFAREAGLPYNRLLVANLIYDLTVGWSEAAPTACSSFSCPSADGTPLLGRNLDWSLPPGIGRHTAVTRFYHGSDCYISIGVAGYLGVVTAMRPGYWALNLNQASPGKKRFNLSGYPVGQYLRQNCDKSRSFRYLVRNLKSYQTVQPYFAHIVGVRPGEHVVLEGLGDHYNARRPEENLLIQTNHFITEEYRHLDVMEWTDEDGKSWVSDTQERYEALGKRLARKWPEDARGCLRFLEEPVANECTCQSMGLHPASGDISLRVLR